jgi:hypothetical protein
MADDVILFHMPRNPSPAANALLSPASYAATGDRIGALGSLLCALHCALLPLAIALLPTLGLGGAALVDFDQGFTVFATLLGVTMLGYGYRRHRAFRAWLVLVPGLALIWIGSFSTLHTHSIGHTLVMVSGGLLVAAAHVINLRLGHAALARAARRPATAGVAGAPRVVGYAPPKD